VPKARIRQVWKNARFQSVFRYFAWAVLVVPFAVWRGGALDTITGTFVPVFVLFTAILLISPREEHLEFLQKAFVLSSALHIGLLKLMGGGWRLTGTGSLDPNDLASLAAIATPLAIGIAQRAKSLRDRLLYVGATLLLIAGVIWTSSRGGTLALLAGLIVFIALLPRQRRGTILLVLLVALPVFWFTASDRYRRRIINISNYDEDYNVTDFWGRKQIWARARIYIARNPVAGVGVRGFETYDGMYMKEIGKTGKWSAPHNAYVQSTAELGIPGGILFVVLLVGAARTAWGFARKSGKGSLNAPRPEYISAMAAYGSGAYFLSHAYSVQMFTLVMLIAFAERIRQSGGAGPTAEVPHAPPVPGHQTLRGWRSARSAAYGAHAMTPVQPNHLERGP
jgi:O-antigen ligase